MYKMGVCYFMDLEKIIIENKKYLDKGQYLVREIWSTGQE